MVDDVEYRCHRCQFGTHTEQQRDQAQVADGGMRQKPFQVVLEHGHVGANQQSCHAGKTDHVEPLFGTSQCRVQTRHQENAGLDHGGGVQVGRNRRWRLHGMGQPEMERELGRLGKRAQQYQRQGDGVHGVGFDNIAGGQHIVQFKTADNVADDQNAREQRQPTATGHRQRHAGATTSVLFVVPETDEQERGETGQFPENHHQQEIAGEYDAQHGAFETEQQRVKLPDILGRLQVIAGIENDQHANNQNQQCEQQRQSIEAEAEGNADRR